jgi:hypothetical protein
MFNKKRPAKSEAFLKVLTAVCLKNYFFAGKSGSREEI